MYCLQFSGSEEEKIKQAVGTFCSNQPFALEIIKTKQKKDSRFTAFIQVTCCFLFRRRTKALPGRHLHRLTRFLPSRKRRVTGCVADCSSKTLFPSRCYGSPNIPCCWRTSLSTQVPGNGSNDLFCFFWARRYKSRFRANLIHLLVFFKLSVVIRPN